MKFYINYLLSSSKTKYVTSETKKNWKAKQSHIVHRNNARQAKQNNLAQLR